jgi:DNA-directed RNA polymerase specialized sigma24 family protein
VDNHRRLAAAKRGAGVSVFSLDGEERDESDPLLAEMSSPMTMPTEGARSAELLRLCREHLEDREWTVWRLRVVVGRGFDAIASLTESSAASVRGVMHRARKRLILALADLDPDGSPE